MTISGKCDTCRSRKVKCDEEKPKCGACRKRDRDCTYSFGKASAFILEDPTQRSKHGRSKVAPVIYAIGDGQGPNHSSTDSDSNSTSKHPSSPTSLALRPVTNRNADRGPSVFTALSVPHHANQKRSKKVAARQARQVQLHMNRLVERVHLEIPRQYLPAQTALAARYLNLIGSRPLEEQPFSIMGTWIESIPSRIGDSRALDTAIEYLMDSFNAFCDPAYSKQRMALATKSRALKELHLAVGNQKTGRSYNTAVATKIHFMSEVLTGIMDLHHVIHSAGLSDILQGGPVTDADEQYFWDFLDNTYFDDVSEAMIASRTSIYDQEVYLQMTSPTAVPIDAPLSFRASVALMHTHIQLPRLVCLVRHASNYPEDSRTLSAAIELACHLWSLVPSDLMRDIVQSSVTNVETPPSLEIADIISDSYHFISIENAMIICRYWNLQVALSAVTQTIYQNHPVESMSSRLPPLTDVEQLDINAAMDLARCVHWSVTICPSIPLVPLRTYANLIISLGTWYRMARRTLAGLRALPPDADPSVTAYFAAKLSRARRMEHFVANEANNVNQMWNMPRVNKVFLRAAAIDMAGGPIPEWMPIRVKFDNEGGAMVMKMEYDVGGPLYEEYVGPGNGAAGWVRKTSTKSPFDPGTSDIGKGFPTGGNGKLPADIFEKSQVPPEKYLGWSVEKSFAEKVSTASGSVPPTFTDMISESGDEDDDIYEN